MAGTIHSWLTPTHPPPNRLNEVRPRWPEQFLEQIAFVDRTPVSMKSGLDGRNNNCSGREGGPHLFPVSMKSGLDGRNNGYTPGVAPHP